MATKAREPGLSQNVVLQELPRVCADPDRVCPAEGKPENPCNIIASQPTPTAHGELHHSTDECRIWAGLDAYAERASLSRAPCARCGAPCSMSPFTTSSRPLTAAMVEAQYELDDLRHLFAHNFAGRADARYFAAKKRHVFAFGKVVPLSSGARFDGTYISLAISHLRYYADQAGEILRIFA